METWAHQQAHSALGIPASVHKHGLSEVLEFWLTASLRSYSSTQYASVLVMTLGTILAALGGAGRLVGISLSESDLADILTRTLAAVAPTELAF